MLDEAVLHKKQMLNEMLRRGVRLSDLETLKRGEILYLWERDVASVRELSDYTKKKFYQIQHICRKGESILYRGKSKIFAGPKTMFGRLKFPIQHIIQPDEYPNFVEWREKTLDWVSMRTGYRMLGKKRLNKLIKEGSLKTLTAVIKGKDFTGIHKKSLLSQLNRDADRLNRSIEELTVYNRSDLDNSAVGENPLRVEQLT